MGWFSKNGQNLSSLVGSRFIVRLGLAFWNQRRKSLSDARFILAESGSRDRFRFQLKTWGTKLDCRHGFDRLVEYVLAMAINSASPVVKKVL